MAWASRPGLAHGWTSIARLARAELAPFLCHPPWYAPPTVTESDLQALERFVIENDELLDLEESIGRFNVFDALGVARAEIKHSNFLAWLLNPAESHGLGDLFLRAVLMDILKKTPLGLRPMNPLELDGAELRGVDIRREWRQVDLVIACDEPNFVIAIEHKIDSGEHGGQLSQYGDRVRAEWPDKRCLKVFLTISGDEASEEDWVAYSYADIHRVLTRVRRTAAGSLGGDVEVFLGHYLNLIGSRMMSNKEIDRLCKHIFINHRRAIELIVERMGTPASAMIASIETWMRGRTAEWTIVGSRSNRLWFLPTSWVGTLCAPDGTCLPLIPAKWYMEAHARETSLHVRVGVGPGDDAASRRSMIETLREDSELGLAVQRKQITDRWTRVLARSVLSWDEDEEPSEAQVTAAMDKYLAEIAPRLRKIPAAVSALSPQG